MKSFFAKLIKWLIFLAICAGLIFLVHRFYTNRQLIFNYVGEQNHFFTHKDKRSNIKIGLCDRNAALSIYAPISLHSQAQGLGLQAVRFASNESLWAALEHGQIDFALVSLDQFAKRAPLSSLLIAFPYAISQGNEGIVCSSAWNKAQNGQNRHIACITNSTGEYLAQVLADASMDSANPLQLAGACKEKEAVELLRSGQAEALVISEPTLTSLQASGYTALADWESPSIIEVCVLKTPQSESQKQKLQQVISQLAKIWFNRLEDLNTMPGPTYSSIAKASGLKRADVRDALRSGLHFLSASEAQELLRSGHLANETLRLAEYWMMSGIYSTTSVSILPDPDKLIFPSPELMRLRTGSLARPRPTRSEPSYPPPSDTRDKVTLPSETDEETASEDHASPHFRADSSDSEPQSELKSHEAPPPPSPIPPSKELSPFTVPKDTDNDAQAQPSEPNADAQAQPTEPNAEAQPDEPGFDSQGSHAQPRRAPRMKQKPSEHPLKKRIYPQ
ncbi:MAG: transporter substrate-binding domain-containing protein [bacterium]|nr:transporter substrate-binding domain-containing protein [bacterium]